MWIEAEDGNIYNLHYAQSVKMQQSGDQFQIVAELALVKEEDGFMGPESSWHKIVLASPDSRVVAQKILFAIKSRLSAIQAIPLRDVLKDDRMVKE